MVSPVGGLDFSLIVATRNRQWDVHQLIATVVSTGYPGIAEVILADDASDVPVRCNVATPFPVRTLRSDEHVGAAVMRNRASEIASGAVLAFLDDDARMFDDWFQIAAGAVGDDRAITGRIVPLDDGLVSRARQWRYEARYQYVGREPVGFFAGGNSAVLRDHFLHSGGFPDATSGADNQLVGRLSDFGVQVHFEPRLRILHRNSKGAGKAAVEAWRAGATRRPIGASAILREATRAVTSAPWRRDAPSALFNVGLQGLHAISCALPANANGRPETPGQAS